MKNKGFLYPPLKINYLLYFIFLLALFCCKNKVYLGLERSALEEKLWTKDYSFLKKIDNQSLPGKEIFEFADGAGLCLGLAANEIGLKDLASHFFTLEIDQNKEPFSQLAAVELLNLLNSEKKYEKALNLAKASLKKYDSSPYFTEILLKKIEALYWLEKNNEVLEEIKLNLKLSDADLLSKYPEVFLFKTVAEAKQEIKGFENKIRDFFFKLKASELHPRLYLWLLANKKLELFLKVEQELFKAKSLLGSAEFKNASQAFESLFPQLEKNRLLNSILITDFTTAVLSAQPQAKHASLLLEAANSLSGDKLIIAENAGRIYFACKLYDAAQTQYETVLKATSDLSLRKRLIWRICKIGLLKGQKHAQTTFFEYAPSWPDPSFYEDLLEEWFTSLLAEKKYAVFLAIEGAIKKYLSSKVQAQLAYICARLAACNLYPLSDSKAKEERIRAWLQEAVDKSGKSYYALLANYFLGKTESFKLEYRERKEESVSSQTKDLKASLSNKEKLFSVYLEFGLYELAFGLYNSFKNEIKPDWLAHWAIILNKRSRHYETIRLIQFLRQSNKPDLSQEEYKAYFPKPYAKLIEQNSKNYDLEETLFYSLLRQESAFHPTIRSKAGAIGLAQFMPETGAWIAKQLKIKDYDLTDPAISLLFCSYYYSFLKKRLEQIPYILAGYNAGPTVARRWKENLSSLPLDLAVEAFPYTESRNFVKAIFINHVYYNLIYETGNLTESVKLFYQF